MIKPTVGRVVDFRFLDAECAPAGFTINDHEQPFAGTVAFVHGERMVNLSVVDHNGVQFPITSVRLLQDDDQPAGESCWAAWMPYQKGQAAKTEQLETKLAGS